MKIEENIQEWLENLQANKPRFSKNSSSKFVQIRSNPVNIDKLTAPDQLLPIRIDLDMEGRKYRDLIVWNLNEPYFTAEQFAKLVSEENNLSANFETEITNLIKRSISNYESVDQLKDECIKTIEIDVRVDNICVKDKFEWDISDNENSPEDFSELICNELGLSHEFSTQIAHQIREQVNSPLTTDSWFQEKTFE